MENNKLFNIDVDEDNLFELSDESFNSLLYDNTTKKNIVWATKDYEHLGHQYLESKEIMPNLILSPKNNVIQPRVEKNKENKEIRTKNSGEVFTPSWICNKQINALDATWFQKYNVFNTELDDGWKTNTEIIQFQNGKSWKEYIKLTRLEVCCGEAPYLTSRYDAITGEFIPVWNRIGMLDRKLRIVNENNNTKDDWVYWAIIAYKSIYAYEFQGDNLFLARENLLSTFVENYFIKFNKIPDKKNVDKIAQIISWNLWQMNGLTNTTPFSRRKKHNVQMSLFDDEINESFEQVKSLIYDWNANKEVTYENFIKG